MWVTFYFAIMLVVGTIIGWFAHCAYLRIDAWGKAMNKREALFHEVTEEDIDHALHRVNVVRFRDGSSGSFQGETAPAKY